MEKYYYIGSDNQQLGPVCPTEFIKYGITNNTLVWKQGMENWTKVGQLPELVSYISRKQKKNWFKEYWLLIVGLIVSFLIEGAFCAYGIPFLSYLSTLPINIIGYGLGALLLVISVCLIMYACKNGGKKKLGIFILVCSIFLFFDQTMFYVNQWKENLTFKYGFAQNHDGSFFNKFGEEYRFRDWCEHCKIVFLYCDQEMNEDALMACKWDYNKKSYYLTRYTLRGERVNDISLSENEKCHYFSNIMEVKEYMLSLDKDTQVYVRGKHYFSLESAEFQLKWYDRDTRNGIYG